MHGTDYSDDTEPFERDPRTEIEALEARIEQLAEEIERARKIAVGARGLLACAAILIAIALFGPARYVAVAMLGAVAAGIGGLVVLGSNRSTREQAEATLAAAEARRAALIGQIDLKIVRH
jgi:hypothetical protein